MSSNTKTFNQLELFHEGAIRFRGFIHSVRAENNNFITKFH